MSAPQAAAEHPHGTLIGVALALTAGYVDTVGFVALFGLFTAHVTGNFVLIGSELANPSHGVLIKLLAFARRSSWYVSSNRGSACPCKTSASFQARL